MQLAATTQFHRRVAFLPGVKVCLKTERPLPYPRSPSTLGGHLKKRRIEAGLLQRQAAKTIGIGVNTLITWEQDGAEPETCYWPAIIAFLGYDPNPAPMTLGECLRAKYRELGLPRKKVALRLGIDEGTLLKYEQGTSRPTMDRTQKLIDQFLGVRRGAKTSTDQYLQKT